jgi:hypothetical protein
MAKKDLTVPEKETRRFRCLRTCYWNGTLWTGEDTVKERGSGIVSTVEFTGPTQIPENFQFENWEEF